MIQDWGETDNKLTKEFEFTDFSEALVFVNQVGKLAEEADHHPDILIHSYKKVRLSLTSHDAGDKVTQKDYDLALKIDQIL